MYGGESASRAVEGIRADTRGGARYGTVWGWDAVGADSAGMAAAGDWRARLRLNKMASTAPQSQPLEGLAGTQHAAGRGRVLAGHTRASPAPPVSSSRSQSEPACPAHVNTAPSVTAVTASPPPFRSPAASKPSHLLLPPLLTLATTAVSTAVFAVARRQLGLVALTPSASAPSSRCVRGRAEPESPPPPPSSAKLPVALTLSSALSQPPLSSRRM
jgi:hypothetical protein